jgi:hypothetical protein
LRFVKRKDYNTPMFRRFMSHVLISLAVFSLTTTFLLWVVDSALLSPARLTESLRRSNVPAAIADELPNAIKDNKATPAEQADMKNKISKVVTPEYVDQKITTIAQTMGEFIRKGAPQPTIDLRDFPAKLRASGIDVGKDLDTNFASPKQLNQDGKLDILPKAYKWLSLAKILGVTLFVAIMVIEWFVAEKGMKLKRLSRVFFHTAFWSFAYWLALVFVPDKVIKKVQSSPNFDSQFNGLISAVTKAIQNLLGVYFLGFAIVCIVVTISLYGIRIVLKKMESQKLSKKPKDLYPTPSKSRTAS